MSGRASAMLLVVRGDGSRAALTLQGVDEETAGAPAG